MDSLTQEQINKMQENLNAALKRKLNSKNAFQTGNNPKATTSKGTERKSVHCNFKLMENGNFLADIVYHAPSIELFKTIPNRTYDAKTKNWSFPLHEHDNILRKLSSLNVTVSGLPRSILNTFKIPEPVLPNPQELEKIDKTLIEALMPFQIEGVRFGISRRGRCLIADDMGLGKTLQALAIALYYIEKWPLLIVCPSSMRFPWEEAFHKFCPSVDPFSVLVMTSGSDDLTEANVVVTSYDLLKCSLDQLMKKKFGVMIFDESHFLKSPKTARTKAALDLAHTANHMILLSGTPALSRPQELYPQLQLIDPINFKNFHEFGLRYCDGKMKKFGWDYGGASNLDELEILLRRRLMIRRLKSEVLTQLPTKVRKVVYLRPKLVQAVYKQLKEYAGQMERQSGSEKRTTLLSYYYMTGSAKLSSICSYLEEKLSSENEPLKMLVFAHHGHVLDGICDTLSTLHVPFIRIDGATLPEARATLCERFQTEEQVRCAVLSIKAANAGITLTAAQLVIFAELYWNPGELTQAEDRAHRIGQKDSVLVEYLIAKNTADDYIWSLVQNKLNVLNQVGLSKDSFKNANVTHLVDNDQKTLDDFWSKKSENQAESGFAAVADDDDDLFNNIDLEKVVNEAKKAKIDC